MFVSCGVEWPSAYGSHSKWLNSDSANVVGTETLASGKSIITPYKRNMRHVEVVYVLMALGTTNGEDR